MRLTMRHCIGEVEGCPNLAGLGPAPPLPAVPHARDCAAVGLQASLDVSHVRVSTPVTPADARNQGTVVSAGWRQCSSYRFLRPRLPAYRAALGPRRQRLRALTRENAPLVLRWGAHDRLAADAVHRPTNPSSALVGLLVRYCWLYCQSATQYVNHKMPRFVPVLPDVPGRGVPVSAERRRCNVYPVSVFGASR